MATSSERNDAKGQFGNLTPDEKTLFDSFREACSTAGLIPQSTGTCEDDMKSGIYDDGTLLRFLRARRFNVDDAFKQYSSMRTWRESNELIELFEHIDVEEYEETRKLYTHWTGRRDKSGDPVFLFEIGKLSPSMMNAYEKSCRAPAAIVDQDGKTTSAESTALLRLFCTYDHLTRFVLPLCSAVPSRSNPETPVTGTNCIVDVSGMGLLHFWRLREHLQAASTLATANYPETLGRTHIIGAPFFFPTIWGWINKWFDPITVSKIFILPAGEVLSGLSATIDPINIPRKYGGKFDFEFGMVPDLDPEIRDILDWLPSEGGGEGSQNLPNGPMRWLNSGSGKRTAVAVGSVRGKQRRVEIFTLC